MYEYIVLDEMKWNKIKNENECRMERKAERERDEL